MIILSVGLCLGVTSFTFFTSLDPLFMYKVCISAALIVGVFSLFIKKASSFYMNLTLDETNTLTPLTLMNQSE